MMSPVKTAPSVATPAGPVLLFAAARRRRRRVRRTAAVVFVILAAAGLAAWLAVAGNPPAGQADRGRPGAGPGRPAAGTGQLAWIDPQDRVVIGNLASLSTRTVAEADADPAVPLVPFGGRLYWIKQSGAFTGGAFQAPAIEALDPAADRSEPVSPGEYVFPSADGTHLYVSLTDSTLGMLPADGAGPWTLPAGWFLPGGFSLAVAGGVLVQHSDTPAIAHAAVLAGWNPLTGRLTTIGEGYGALGAYTPPGQRYSLLAWVPAGCPFPFCPVRITNTVTLASRTVRSPLGYGFVAGGAFAPDGRQLAVFCYERPRRGVQTAELAIIDAGTGAVRLVPGVRATVGEDTGWIRWLPDGTRLVVLADSNYLVTSRTLVVQPLRFAGGGHDITFSATLLPAPG